jgi:hypothetical protein
MITLDPKKFSLALPPPTPASRLREAATHLRQARGQILLAVTSSLPGQLGKDASALEFIGTAIEAVEKRVSEPAAEKSAAVRKRRS